MSLLNLTKMNFRLCSKTTFDIKLDQTLKTQWTCNPKGFVQIWRYFYNDTDFIIVKVSFLFVRTAETEPVGAVEFHRS